MARRPNDFQLGIRRLLAEKVGQVCSAPHCRLPTTGPTQDGHGTVRRGKAAHIYPAGKGPRWDRTVPPATIRSESNGIWLCASCADTIDTDPDYYTVALLLSWKERAEDDQRKRLRAEAGFVSAILQLHCRWIDPADPRLPSSKGGYLLSLQNMSERNNCSNLAIEFLLMPKLPHLGFASPSAGTGWSSSQERMNEASGVCELIRPRQTIAIALVRQTGAAAGPHKDVVLHTCTVTVYGSEMPSFVFTAAIPRWPFHDRPASADLDVPCRLHVGGTR